MHTTGRNRVWLLLTCGASVPWQANMRVGVAVGEAGGTGREDNHLAHTQTRQNSGYCLPCRRYGKAESSTDVPLLPMMHWMVGTKYSQL